MPSIKGNAGPHAGQPVAKVGTPLATAAAALIPVHGCGGGAAGMLGLADLGTPPGTACLAPQAVGGTLLQNTSG